MWSGRSTWKNPLGEEDFFERMVKSTKRCLRKMIGQARFTIDELRTAVVEVESILNSRPLSYISSDDLDEPITPSHLLMGRRVLSLPDNLCLYQDPDDEDYSGTTEHLDRRMKHLTNLLNHFWRRWRNEYLLELRDAHRHHKGNEADPTIKVGDVVIVHDESLPRVDSGRWQRWRISSLAGMGRLEERLSNKPPGIDKPPTSAIALPSGGTHTGVQ